MTSNTPHRLNPDGLITREIAAHVLHSLDYGGWPGDRFIRALLSAYEAANAENRAKLATAFPDPAAAYQLTIDEPFSGVKYLLDLTTAPSPLPGDNG